MVGGLAMCEALAGGALCLSVAVALVDDLLVNEKLEREGVYGWKM